MIEHKAVFLIAVVLFLCVLLGTAAVYLRRARKLAGADTVDVLLHRLVPVDRQKLEHVAADLTDSEESADSVALEPWQVWELAGGLAGIEALATNCEVLIELACYVQQWYPEALPVAEQLRLNAREILWHLERLRGAEQRGHLRAAYPEYAQRAVAIYCGMTRHVIALYEATGTAGVQQLQAVL